MRIAAFFILVLTSSLLHSETLLMDSQPVNEKDSMPLQSAKQFAQSEFLEGNFGSTSFICEYLEKNNIDEPRFKLLWAASQSRMGNWAKAEKLYVGVINHKKSTRKQKSVACVYLAKQQLEPKNREVYADMALGYYKNSFVIEMVSQIYKELEVEALIASDKEKAEYYKRKYDEFVKTTIPEKNNEIEVGKF